MTNQAIIGLLLASALGMASANMSPAAAQSTIGGAKTQQNKIGGVAKPAPVIGGATHVSTPPAPPKPAPMVGSVKPVSPGTMAPGTTGAATPGSIAGNPRPNSPVTPPNKGGTVVTSNLKCGSGACSTGIPKP